MQYSAKYTEMFHLYVPKRNQIDDGRKDPIYNKNK